MKKRFLLSGHARGQSLVELAISIVILLMLLAGAVEFGIIFFQYVQIRDAAQEGALYGSTHPPTNGADSTQITAIANRAKASSNKPIDLVNDPNVTVTVLVTGQYCEGGALQVKVTYKHKIFMPFLPRAIGQEIPLNAAVTDTILTPICPGT